MKRNLLTKTLLLATGLLVGAGSAWAYDVPENKEICKVILGNATYTDGVITSATAETFETVDAVPSGWSGSNSAIAEVTEVAKPEIDITLEDGNSSSIVPTYVSGKTLRGRQKGNTNYAAAYSLTYDFSAISSGILVFSADLFASGDINAPIEIAFVDSEGNNVLAFNTANSSGYARFQQKIGDGSFTSVTSVGLFRPRKFVGWEISELVINMETGATNVTIDFIADGGTRKHQSFSSNIGTEKSIAALKLGRSYGSSSTERFTHIDNVLFYHVDNPVGTYNYTIKAKSGDTDLATLDSGTAREGQSYTVSLNGLSKVIEKGGHFYVLNDANVTDFGFSQTYTMGDADEEQIISYSEDPSIVYFAEAENMVNAVGTTEGSYSGGKYAAINSGRFATLKELPGAVYQLSTNVIGNANRNVVIRSANSNTDAVKLAGISSTGERTANFTLIQNTTLYLSGYTTTTSQVNRSADFDYIIIRKTADLPSTVDIADNGVGYATFSSDYNLDFEGSNVTAYVATEATMGLVKFEQVTTVPAKTGLFLKGNGTVNVTTSAVTAPVTNYLKPTTGAAVAASNKDDNGVYHYVFAKQGDDLGFYNLGSDLTMTVGKAYLETSESIAPAGSRVAFVFEDETTGIADVRNNKTDGLYYNLNGQRVEHPAKGLYIVNGKKFINK